MMHNGSEIEKKSNPVKKTREINQFQGILFVMFLIFHIEIDLIFMRFFYGMKFLKFSGPL